MLAIAEKKGAHEKKSPLGGTGTVLQGGIIKNRRPISVK